MEGADELKAWVKTRGGIRKVVTKKCKDIESVSKDETIEGREALLQGFGNMLREKKIILEDYNNKILAKFEEGGGGDEGGDLIDKEIDGVAEYDEAICVALARVDLLKSKTSAIAPVVHRNTNKRIEHARLPKLALPKFGGNILEWPAFWEGFESSVDQNIDLSNIDKFNYLRSLLEGQASACISGLALSGKNYQEAIDLLKARFGDEQKLITNCIESLMNLQPIKGDSELSKIRELYDKTEANIRSLKALNIDSKNYGPIMLPMIMPKLPPAIRLDITRKNTKGWDFNEILENLLAEITAREKCSTEGGERGNEEFTTSSFPSFQRGPNHENGRGASWGAGERGHNWRDGGAPGGHMDSGAQKAVCVFCKRANHQSSECKRVVGADKRLDFLRKESRCFICTGKSHRASECKSRAKCGVCHDRRHHTSLCYKSKGGLTPTKTGGGGSGASSVVSGGAMGGASGGASGGDVKSGDGPTICGVTNTRTPVLLQTAKTIAADMSGTTHAIARVMLDTGAQKSYIERDLAKKLKLEIHEKCAMVVSGFGGVQNKLVDNEVVKLKLSTLIPGKQIEISAHVVDKVCSPLKQQFINGALDAYPHLRGLKLAEIYNDGADLPINILIGADYYWDICTGHTKRGEEGPCAIKTRMGWVLSGPLDDMNQVGEKGGYSESSNLNIQTHVLLVRDSAATSLNKQVEKFWSLESSGIIPDEGEGVYDSFIEDINFDEGKYSVSLPWKSEVPDLPDNMRQAMGCLASTVRKLKRDPETLQKYNQIIMDQLEQGIISKCENTKLEEGGGDMQKGVHYLSHHPVIKPHKESTKLRIVYNASMKAGRGESLNDCLYKGPKLNELLLNVLLRFRIHQTAFIADIKQAFLRVGVKKEDRDYLRFLWPNRVDMSNPTIETYRFNTLVFGLTCSPFLLNATLKQHLEKFKPKKGVGKVEKLGRSLYVDDLNCGAGNAEEAFDLYNMASEILREGGFHLHKFHTNDSRLEYMVKGGSDAKVAGTDGDSQSYTQVSYGDENAERKVLGVTWDNVMDTFQMDLAPTAEKLLEPDLTKRGLLSAMAAFYDPLGIVSPLTLALKICFQESCKTKLGWDEALPIDTQRKLGEWGKQAKSRGVIETERYCLGAGVVTIDLVGFSDGSKLGYGASIYLRCKMSNGVIKTKLLVSKTRVAPIETTSIPRMELLGCLILARLADNVRKAIETDVKIHEVILFSDSATTLWWIKSGAVEYKQWVHSRVREIRSLFSGDEWNYVDTKSNPSDLASRGCGPFDLGELWFQGPEFLKTNDKSKWPKLQNFEKTDLEKCTTKVNRSSSSSVDKIVSQNMLLANSTEQAAGEIENVSSEASALPPLDPSDPHPRRRGAGQRSIMKHTTKISHLMTSTRYGDLNKLLRVTAIVVKFTKLLRRQATTSSITAEDMRNAHDIWIADAQRGEIAARPDTFRKQAASLRLFQDEGGLYRSSGRINHSTLPEDTKTPLWLPRDSHITKLIIIQAHHNVEHLKVESTLMQLRSRYWIVRGRQTVKSVVSKCLRCAYYDTRAYDSPPTAQLPTMRVAGESAFSNLGIDYAGPLLVHDIYNRSSLQKAYILVATCALSRAVHLELVPNLGAEALQRALERMFSRRGRASIILSDNFKTFKAKEIADFASRIGVNWRYNLEATPWWGGFFERLVGTTKRTLKKMLGKQSLTYEELETSLARVEAAINSRPLTYVSEDIFEPLTPLHLIFGKRLNNEHTSLVPDNIKPGELRGRTKYIHGVVTECWERWGAEYLTSLRERGVGSSRNAIEPMVGDVVLVEQNLKARVHWPMARVTELIRGKDGIVRGARIKLRGGTILNRPVQKLYPIEIQGESSTSDSGDPKMRLGERQSLGDSGDPKIRLGERQSLGDSGDPKMSLGENQTSGSLEDSNQSPGRHHEDGVPVPARPRRMAAGTGELIRRLRDEVE